MAAKCVVLDLDGTLIHSWAEPSFVDEYELMTDPQYTKLLTNKGTEPVSYEFTLEDGSIFYGLFRPQLWVFLDFLQEHFEHVYVWSAGADSYVEMLVQRIFADTGRPLPELVYSRKDCLYDNDRELWHKPLTRILEYGKMDITDVLIIDDNTYTFLDNPQNGLLLPSYEPGVTDVENDLDGLEEPEIQDLLDRTDTALLKIKEWILKNDFSPSSDMRMLDKNIF